MDYLSVTQAAQKWGLSSRRVRLLCSQGKIEGVTQEGGKYLIPSDTPKPADGRKQRGKTISPPFVALFRQADGLKAELKQHRPLTQGELEALQNEFLISYTYNSNAIEGSTLTLKETALVLEGITIDQKPLRDHLEAVGHRDAFLYVEELAKTNTAVTEREIKAVHSLVLADRPMDKGVYRRVPVQIMGAHTQPAQPYLIEPAMTALLLENKKRIRTVHPIERIARFHLQFESIHPFIDGNGRTGRMLMNLDLIRQGYPPINVKFADRRQYYDAFDAFSRHHNADPMIRLVSDYIIGRLRGLLAILDA